MMTIMRYEDGHKEAIRLRIIRAASRALRRQGLDGIGIPALMKEVGMTHGGFYAHFKNRDELVAHAVHEATVESSQGVFDENLSLKETLLRYLSIEHVENPEGGCVVAALGTDGTRQPPKIRKAFAEAAVGIVRHIQAKLSGTPFGNTKELSDQAMVSTATMVGAVVLARLANDPVVAKRMLDAARKSIL